MVDQVKRAYKISAPSGDIAEEIANDILNFIIERTKEGKGKDGKAFPKYSKSYMNSLNYKIAGKDGTVDLVLSGEMLESLKVLEVKKNEVVIGYEKGDDLNARAEGNILGSYGGEPNKKKARDFLDLSAKEIGSIEKKYKGEIEDQLRRIETQKLARVLANDIVRNLDFDIEDEGDL